MSELRQPNPMNRLSLINSSGHGIKPFELNLEITGIAGLPFSASPDATKA
jgi:hypothetical protein